MKQEKSILMKQGIVRILGEEGARNFLFEMGKRKKISCRSPKRISADIPGVSAIQCRDVLYFISKYVYGKYISTKSQKEITTPTIRSKFKWYVVPSQLVIDLAQSYESHNSLEKANGSNQTGSEFANDETQTILTEEIRYKRTTIQHRSTVHHSATSVQSGKRKKRKKYSRVYGGLIFEFFNI